MTSTHEVCTLTLDLVRDVDHVVVGGMTVPRRPWPLR
jgi:hypothetical protein